MDVNLADCGTFLVLSVSRGIENTMTVYRRVSSVADWKSDILVDISSSGAYGH